MITVISGTNARDSNTIKVANICHQFLLTQNVDCQLLDLMNIPPDFLSGEMYEKPTPAFEAFQEKYLLPTEKFAIVIPEYNGGVPGIFKLMIDASDIKRAWWGKKASIIGVASGRSGNLRGLDHLTNMLNYLHVNVLWNKIPVSRIEELLDEKADLAHGPTIKLLHQQMVQLIEF